MPAEHTYDYAIIRVVPRVERGERINVGVILSCADAGVPRGPDRARRRRGSWRSIRRSISRRVRANLAIIPRGVPRRRRRRPDRRAAAARPLPLAGVAAQHDDPDVAGAHRSHRRSRRGAGAAGRSDGAAAVSRPVNRTAAAAIAPEPRLEPRAPSSYFVFVRRTSSARSSPARAASRTASIVV